jgi:hypothetical protein
VQPVQRGAVLDGNRTSDLWQALQYFWGMLPSGI